MTVPEAAIAFHALGLDDHGPAVVAIGGGHGLAAALQAIQCYAGEITAVVSVGDDGGSSGRLKSGLGIPPPGDIRRCLLALSPEPSIWWELFAYRFEEADVEGHSLGNLMLAALTDLLSDFESAVRRAGDLLGAVGVVVPAAAQATHLEAVVGGRTVRGQVAISQARGGVEKLTVGPKGVRATPRAMEAITEADQIVLGPGSLFTSVLAVLLVPGIAEAVAAAGAAKVFVLNLITQDGETLGLSGPDHIGALAGLAGLTGPGAIVAHRGALEVPEGLDRVTLEPEEAARLGWRMLEEDVADQIAAWPQHDPMKLGRALQGLSGTM
ncbi:MAG: gluconeogenesis factor YvcK family protein [Acidimicrobiia bacterium]